MNYPTQVRHSPSSLLIFIPIEDVNHDQKISKTVGYGSALNEQEKCTLSALASRDTQDDKGGLGILAETHLGRIRSKLASFHIKGTLESPFEVD